MKAELSAELESALGKRYLDAYEVTVGKVTGSLDDGIEMTGTAGAYTMFMTPTECSCTCPDFLSRKVLCKHLIAMVIKGNLKGVLSDIQVATLLLNRKDVN